MVFLCVFRCVDDPIWLTEFKHRSFFGVSLWLKQVLTLWWIDNNTRRALLRFSPSNVSIFLVDLSNPLVFPFCSLILSLKRYLMPLPFCQFLPEQRRPPYRRAPGSLLPLAASPPSSLLSLVRKCNSPAGTLGLSRLNEIENMKCERQQRRLPLGLHASLLALRPRPTLASLGPWSSAAALHDQLPPAGKLTPWQPDSPMPAARNDHEEARNKTF